MKPNIITYLIYRAIRPAVELVLEQREKPKENPPGQRAPYENFNMMGGLLRNSGDGKNWSLYPAWFEAYTVMVPMVEWPNHRISAVNIEQKALIMEVLKEWPKRGELVLAMAEARWPTELIEQIEKAAANRSYLADHEAEQVDPAKPIDGAKMESTYSIQGSVNVHGLPNKDAVIYSLGKECDQSRDIYLNQDGLARLVEQLAKAGNESVHSHFPSALLNLVVALKDGYLKQAHHGVLEVCSPALVSRIALGMDTTTDDLRRRAGAPGGIPVGDIIAALIKEPPVLEKRETIGAGSASVTTTATAVRPDL